MKIIRQNNMRLLSIFNFRLSTCLPAGKASRRAFTLIEILVVVAIIGVLGAMVFISLDRAQARSRDSRRAADLDGLQVALRLYYLDTKTLPLNKANIEGSTGWCTPGRDYSGTTYPGICLGELKDGGYIDKLPTDPKSPTQEYGYYNYTKYAVVGTITEAPARYGPFPYGYNCSDIVAPAGGIGGFWAGMECDSIPDATERSNCVTEFQAGRGDDYEFPEGITPREVGASKRYCTGYLLQ